MVVAWLDDFSADVWDHTKGFGQHQRIDRRGRMDTSAGEVIAQAADIVVRIVSSQGELKAVLSGLCAVAGPRVATQAGQGWIDIADEIDLEVGGDRRMDADGLLVVAERHVDFGIPGMDRLDPAALR